MNAVEKVLNSFPQNTICFTEYLGRQLPHSSLEVTGVYLISDEEAGV